LRLFCRPCYEIGVLRINILKIRKVSSILLKCTPIVRHSLTIGGAFFMAKFSSTEKIQAVKRYLDGTESGKTIAKSIELTPS